MGPSRDGTMTDDSPHPPSSPTRLNGDGALGPVPFFMPGSPATNSCIPPGISDALAGLYLTRTAPGTGNVAPATASKPPRGNAAGISLPRPLWPSIQRTVTKTRQRADRTRPPIAECDALLVGRIISQAVGSRSFAAFGLSVDSNDRVDLHSEQTNRRTTIPCPGAVIRPFPRKTEVHFEPGRRSPNRTMNPNADIAAALGQQLWSTDSFLPEYRPGEHGPWRINPGGRLVTDWGYVSGPRLLEMLPSLSRRSISGVDQEKWEVWMSLTPHEVESQELGYRYAFGNVVIMGLGMGWIAANAALNPEVTAVTVVEQDPDVISLFQDSGAFDSLAASARSKISIA